jgi:hypothetical protein
MVLISQFDWLGGILFRQFLGINGGIKTVVQLSRSSNLYSM